MRTEKKTAFNNNTSRRYHHRFYKNPNGDRHILNLLMNVLGLWDDPPGYYELAVWPRYLDMRVYIESDINIKKQIHMISVPNEDLFQICSSLIPAFYLK